MLDHDPTGIDHNLYLHINFLLVAFLSFMKFACIRDIFEVFPRTPLLIVPQGLYQLCSVDFAEFLLNYLCDMAS